MKKIVVIAFCLISYVAFSHSHHSHNDENIHLKKWTFQDKNISKEGSFLMYKNGEVYIEGHHQEVVHFPLTALSKIDQDFVKNKYNQIATINKQIENVTETKELLSWNYSSIAWYSTLGILLLLGTLSLFWFKNKSLKVVVPILAACTVALFYGFKQKTLSFVTNPLTVDSAFAPFKNQVNTRWDNTYFYVESNGMAKHEMMAGITGWQQQVPIPQCYFGTNAWSIPLNPEIATTPVPVNSQHFLKGAVAVAVNGIAIFNPYTNTGVDAYLDGQLDVYGGHSGRADDYHYHIAPTHLYSKTSEKLPIAYALDGFAVYGSKEPDGSNMTTLDANHGHFGKNGVYHYHASTSAPYMIGNMVGKVTEDVDLQIIPQAQTYRPAQTPLKGAVITSNVAYTNGMGYVLTYTLNNQIYKLDYSWDNVGNYTFNLISPTSTTISKYKQKTICTGGITGIEEVLNLDKSISIYPNPATDNINFNIAENISSQIKSIKIISTKGNILYQSSQLKSNLNIDFLTKGQYLVVFELDNAQVTKKLVVK